MRILITGGTGQLAYHLKEDILKTNHDLKLTDSTYMDIRDAVKTKEIITAFKPDIVIHCAAYTNVDQCEKLQDYAYTVNALGTRNIANACRKINAKLAYISTDFVFDGAKKSPYTEFDTPRPLNIYGKSKLAGEVFVKSLLHEYFIIRTSWLYGMHGSNFVKTIRQMAEEKKVLAVVNDQVGSPTFAGDLAKVILKLIESENYGIYHCSNQGQCSWYEFAEKIIEFSRIDETRITPITSEELNRPAPRPKFSVLNNYMLKLQDIHEMPNWVSSLENFLQQRGDES